MAKDKKTDKGTASTLPKSIAGAKLPKGIRKKLAGLAKHPVVADLLAAGLVALAAKLKNEPKPQKAAAKADDKIKTASATATKTVAQATPAVSQPVANAAGTPAVKRVRKPTTVAASSPPAKPKATAKPKPAPKSAAKATAPQRPAAKRTATSKTPKTTH